jgi:hypothetical protein
VVRQSPLGLTLTPREGGPCERPVHSKQTKDGVEGTLPQTRGRIITKLSPKLKQRQPLRVVDFAAQPRVPDDGRSAHMRNY